MVYDQAEILRQRLKALKTHAKAVAVMSGKGGVGKSNFSLNFSLALQKANKRVLLFDLDIGMGNIDILLGETSMFTIVDFFDRGLSLTDIITQGPNGLDFIAGGTSLGSVFKLDEEKFQRFITGLEQLFKIYDYVIFDMSAGVSEESLRFLLSVDEIIVITTPEPTSMTDAYSAMKHICLNDDTIPFSVVVNRAFNTRIGESAFIRLAKTMNHFLNRHVFNLGMIPDDSTIIKAVIDQKPFLLAQPGSQASRAILNISNLFLIRNQLDEKSESGTKTFITKLKHFFMKGR